MQNLKSFFKSFILITPAAFLLIIFYVLMPGCNCYSQTAGYKYQVPGKFNDGWEVSSLNAEGINTEIIEEITRLILDVDKYDQVLSMAIVKNGKLVHEAYSPYCQRNTLHVLASITKTVTSTLIGIAIDKGFIESIDSKLYELLPHYSEYFSESGKKKIALRNIVTMTSGLEWFERVSYNNPKNSEFQMVESEDWIKYVVSRPMENEPGTRFNYNTGSIHLLGEVIKTVSGLHAHQFAEKHLLHPMGIYGYQWNKDPKGYPCTGGTDGGIGLRTRDIAKFGWLFLKDGKWNGKQIISQNWIEEAPKNHSAKMTGRGNYGFNWFSGVRMANGKRFDYKASFGYGGQTLFIVPEYDLIIVFTCDLAEGNAGVNTLVNRTFEACIR
ncbi:serine hydrolase domain-containing protein [candidate division KSB1 bacterium]